MENENIVTIQFKFTRDKALLLMALFFLCWHPKPLNSETLTLTTYYPAPYGGYVSLLTTDKTLLARDSGNVGIGTPGPIPANVALAVYSKTSQGNISIGGVSDGGATYSSLSLNDNNIQPTIDSWALVHKNGAGTVEGDDFQIVKTNAGAIRKDLSIDAATGNVGIAEIAPSRRLTVAGDLRIGTVGAAGTGGIYGLCHTQVFGGGVSTCTGGTIVTAIYGQECATGGVLLKANGANMMLASNWVPHMAQNCSGTMLCCRIFPDAN